MRGVKALLANQLVYPDSRVPALVIMRAPLLRRRLLRPQSRSMRRQSSLQLHPANLTRRRLPPPVPKTAGTALEELVRKFCAANAPATPFHLRTRLDPPGARGPCQTSSFEPLLKLSDEERRRVHIVSGHNLHTSGSCSTPGGLRLLCPRSARAGFRNRLRWRNVFGAPLSACSCDALAAHNEQLKELVHGQNYRHTEAYKRSGALAHLTWAELASLREASWAQLASTVRAHFGLLGVTERFDESIEALSALLQRAIPQATTRTLASIYRAARPAARRTNYASARQTNRTARELARCDALQRRASCLDLGCTRKQIGSSTRHGTAARAVPRDATAAAECAWVRE